MTSLSFREHMSGFVTFGETDFNEGLRRGRADDTACAFTITIDIDDVDAFIRDPARTAAVSGTLDCGALGGTLPVEGGSFKTFVPQGEDSRHLHMQYRLFVSDREARPITLVGFKDIQDGQGLDIWSDTTTLFVRLVRGHVESGEGAPADRLAAGVLNITHAGFTKMLASMRARGGAPWRRAAAIATYQRAFTGTLFKVYGGRAARTEQSDFPDAAHPAGDPFRGAQPGAWEPLAGHTGLRRRILPLRAGDGLPLTLHNIRGPAEPTAAPVLCLHGTGVRGDIFVGPPGGTSPARALIDAGHDVWIANWRASIDLPPRPYTLDQAAVFDHPAAIAEVRRQTGAPTIKVFAHCQGSTSFTMTALAGLADDVTEVVSSAVSLHTVVPRATRMKGRFVLPLLGLRMFYVSAQWGVRPPTALAKAFARMARLARRECDNPVCALGNYMYGTGPDVLWVHAKLDASTHDWTSREFGFAPYRFLRQMYHCTVAGHLVPSDDLPAMPRDLLAQPVPQGQRWTFIAGTKNRLYLPEGQERSHAWFNERSGDGRHSFVSLDGYGHLDPLLGPDAARDVFPAILAGLADNAGRGQPASVAYNA